MKGTICSAVIPILLAAILCSPVSAGVPTDGTAVVTTLEARGPSGDGDRSFLPGTQGGETSSLLTSFSTGESPETTGESETAPPVGSSTGNSDPRGPGWGWGDPRDLDVELATWGKVKDLFSE